MTIRRTNLLGTVRNNNLPISNLSNNPMRFNPYFPLINNNNAISKNFIYLMTSIPTTLTLGSIAMFYRLHSDIQKKLAKIEKLDQEIAFTQDMLAGLKKEQQQLQLLVEKRVNNTYVDHESLKKSSEKSGEEKTANAHQQKDTPQSLKKRNPRGTQFIPSRL